MPFINGRYYMNPFYGRAVEKTRVEREGGVWTEEDPEPARRAVSHAHFWDEEWPSGREPSQEADFWDDDAPSSGTPQQDSNAHWVTINGRHVLIHEAQGEINESSPVNRLTVGDIAGIVYNETASLSNSGKQNDSIGAARANIARAIINADVKYGNKRDQLAGTAPSAVTKAGMGTDAYQSSIAAAKAAYGNWKAGKDSTGGASHFNLRPNASTGNFRPSGTRASGFPLKTHSGPYDNSYPTAAVPERGIYVNTYE